MRNQLKKYMNRFIMAGLLTASLGVSGCGRKQEPVPVRRAGQAEGQIYEQPEEEISAQIVDKMQGQEAEQSAKAETEAEKEPVLTEFNGNVSPEESYLGGATLMLLDSADGGQNLSCVIQTKNGSVIVIDGGRPVDDVHLVEVIRSMGGRVSAWLITHPHDDHIGALTSILNQNPIPVEIDDIYYSFLNVDYYSQGENMGRLGNLLDLLEAFKNVEPEKLHTPLEPGFQFAVDDVSITIMNEPFACPENTFNNSSVGYRLEVNGKRLLFLGDMGWQAGENILKVCKPEDLKADVVQMAHHGQDGVEKDVYEVISPKICLWPTPQWLWDNEKDGVAGEGPYKTLIVREWMESLGVKCNLSIKDGDQILR